MRRRGVFVTGTDTEVGKTLVAAALLHAVAGEDWVTGAMKPVASGCEHVGDRWVNEDALALQEAATLDLAYDTVNPYAFRPAIAPHFAAEDLDVEIDLVRLACGYEAIRDQADLTVVEGAGGWRVPLGDTISFPDLVRRLEVPVLLVVGVRLGCINHALLTAEAIAADGHRLIGWVANRIDPDDPCAEREIRALKHRLSAPLFGVVPFRSPADPRAAASAIDGRRFCAALDRHQ